MPKKYTAKDRLNFVNSLMSVREARVNANVNKPVQLPWENVGYAACNPPGDTG